MFREAEAFHEAKPMSLKTRYRMELFFIKISKIFRTSVRNP